MKLLFDTNALNYYLASLGNLDEKSQIPSRVNIEGLVNVVRAYRANRSLLLHSATLHELFVKCVKENFTLEQNPIGENKVLIKRFQNDYNNIIREGFRAISEKNFYHFDLERMEDHFNNKNKPFAASTIIDQKINVETQLIGHFFMLINLISTEVLFDTYGDLVDEELFYRYTTLSLHFMNAKISEILNQYYYTNEKKEVGTKSLDNLLCYMIAEFEYVIRNKSSLARSAHETIDFLDHMYESWNALEIGSEKGAEMVHRIICQGRSSSDIRKLIQRKFYEFTNELKSKSVAEGGNTSPTQDKYLLHLLEKVLLNQYKISKNDFTDCILLSSCDMISTIQGMDFDKEIVFITFDARLKSFIEQNDIYYNKEIYDLIYR